MRRKLNILNKAVVGSSSGSDRAPFTNQKKLRAN